jgi:hypothetical protein
MTWFSKLNAWANKIGQSKSKDTGVLHFLSSGGASNVLKVGMVAVGGLIAGAVVAPVLAGGGALGGAGSLGKNSNMKLKDIFKKKEGGGVLSNVIPDAIDGLKTSVLQSLGDSLGALGSKVALAPGPPTVLGTATKKSFTADTIKNLPSWVWFVVGAVVIGLSYLIFRKK